jgi:hypothetical protein
MPEKSVGIHECSRRNFGRSAFSFRSSSSWHQFQCGKSSVPSSSFGFDTSGKSLAYCHHRQELHGPRDRTPAGFFIFRVVQGRVSFLQAFGFALFWGCDDGTPRLIHRIGRVVVRHSGNA